MWSGFFRRDKPLSRHALSDLDDDQDLETSHLNKGTENLDDDEAIDGLDDGKGPQHNRFPRSRFSGRWQYFAVAFNIILFLFSLAIVTFSILNKPSACSEKACSAFCEFHPIIDSPFLYESSFIPAAPVFDRLDIKASIERYDFPLRPEEAQSIFQKRPTPESEEAWNRFSNTQSVALTADDIRNLGHDADSILMVPEQSPERHRRFFGRVDVFHQIHCLNVLRRTAWPQYYGNMWEKHNDGTSDFEDHMLHCQYVLLQTLLCHADLEVSVFKKPENGSGALGANAGFTLNRKCRNFDELMAWKEANEVHVV